MSAERVTEVLDEAECLRLIAPGGIGRIAYSGRFGQAILPVNYERHDGAIVFRRPALRLHQLTGSPASGGVGRPGETQLHQHLRGARQPEAVPDQGADGGRLERLGVQAREHPPGGGVKLEPVEGLPGA
jgi:hypothetical protein